MVGWLRARRLRLLLLRFLFWLKGYSYAALKELDRDACPPWPDALAVVPHLHVIHVVGLHAMNAMTSWPSCPDVAGCSSPSCASSGASPIS